MGLALDGVALLIIHAQRYRGLDLQQRSNSTLHKRASGTYKTALGVGSEDTSDVLIIYNFLEVDKSFCNVLRLTLLEEFDRKECGASALSHTALKPIPRRYWYSIDWPTG